VGLLGISIIFNISKEKALFIVIIPSLHDDIII
jgi:hypothetical protein